MSRHSSRRFLWRDPRAKALQIGIATTLRFAPKALQVIKLMLAIGKNGTEERAEVQGAPTPEVMLRCEPQGRQWIFAPYPQDGAAIQVKQNTSTHVNVIKSR